MAPSVSDSLVAGAVSGLVTRTVIQPLDVLKVRFQLQLEPIHKASQVSKYRGLAQAVQSIVREETVMALWKGLLAGQLLYIVYGATQFATFDAFRGLLSPYTTNGRVLKTAVNFSVGGMAGVAAATAAHPLDVLRTRIIGQGEPKVYRNVFHATVLMYGEGGFRTFYKGYSAALISIAPNTALYFTLYHSFTSTWDKMISHKTSSTTLKTATCGALAGILSKVFLLPLDLVKKRLEVQGFEDARYKFGQVGHYSGFFNCLISVAKQEGPKALYKGFIPSLVKSGVTVGISFLVYEHTLHFLQAARAKQ